MTARDVVIKHVDNDRREAEFIITDNAKYTLTKQFDEAIIMAGLCGLEYINATIFYQCDEDTKLELAWIEFDDGGKYIDGFTYCFAEDTLTMLKIKWK